MSRRDFQSIHMEILKKESYSETEASKLFLLSMKAIKEFRFAGILPDWLILENIVCEKGQTRYYFSSRSEQAECPCCHTISICANKDYKNRVIQDLSSDETAVLFDINAKRYRCENINCDQDLFVERFYDLVAEKGRKTKRFINHCVNLSLVCGSLGAERVIRSEGGIVSDDSIIRYLKDKAAQVISGNLGQDKVEVMGVDDINLRKGDSSSACTVFVDSQTGKVLIMVEGTDKESVQKVLLKFPGAELMSRDRACSLSSAGDECGKTQVADRFHLVQNIHQVIKEALAAELPAQIFIRDGDSWLEVRPDGKRPEKVTFHVAEADMEKRIQLAGLSKVAAEKYRNTLKMLELSDQGLRTAEIAKELGISQNVVTALRRKAVTTIQSVQDKIDRRIKACSEQSKDQGRSAADDVKTHSLRPAKDSIVEPYRATVVEMWNSGSSHHKIYPVLVQQGFQGSKATVYQYIGKLELEEPSPLTRLMKRHKPSENDPRSDNFDKEEAQALPKQSLAKVSRNTTYKEVLKEASVTRVNKTKKETKNEGDEAASATDKQASKRPAMAKYSPLEPEILDLMYGHRDRKADDEAAAASKAEKAKKKGSSIE